ncbi:MAG TPA: CehA/McbA family metallohydrolase [Pirellulales bacterium]|jgi:hypothetical protein|nr:CehA/McbA family metallohydrolase [Pirellulales bacterium]
MQLPSIRCCVALVVLQFAALPALAAEIAILGPETWDEYVPQGKEVDAIYGDIVIRSDKLVAVIAKPVATRNANMTVKNVGGCLLDFTVRDRQNDQLGAWYPLGKAMHWEPLSTTPNVDGTATKAAADKVTVQVAATIEDEKLTAETTYELVDGADYLNVETKLTNLTVEPIDYEAIDQIRADGTVFVKGNSGKLAWSYDRWWNAAYGVVAIVSPTVGDSAEREVTVPAKGSLTITRRVYVADDLNALQQLAGVTQADGAKQTTIEVVDEAHRPIAGAYVEIKDGDKLVVSGKTDAEGNFTTLLAVKCKAVVSSAAHGEQTVDVAPGKSAEVRLPISGTVVAAVTDSAGRPIPCKVQFRGTEGTKSPYFFEKSGEHAVGNLYYAHNGSFRLDMPPGNYDCTISYGPEYDVVEQAIEVRSGSETPVKAALARSVDARGWVSTDFHNHATPSGDNVSSQYGRVLNLLCEQVEFAPCTEHNRLSSYAPHLKRLGVEHLLASCVGIELTSAPLPLGHNNAFPLHLHEHQQDNGAPLPDEDPEVQVARLALWDDRSDKLVQQNHPDLGWLLFDRNGDGKPDGGYSRVLPHLDVIEVHPPKHIFDGALLKTDKGNNKNNTIFNWLQLLNQGIRTPGVVNTDAHYNIHGSGWMRNWIACPTDEPGNIDVLDIVHAAEHGHIIMSTGPFLSVRATTAAAGKASTGIAGDELRAPGGKATLAVRVQCPNWFDVDRVQVFINGRPDEQLNFTRAKHSEMFSNDTVKFDREIPLTLAGDAHVIVATIGEKSPIGHVVGPEHERDPPVAVSNPIYFDVDGDGFTANKDTLGAPLPVKSGTAK